MLGRQTALSSSRLIKAHLYEQVARIAKATASPKRLELLELLSQAPKAVEDLAKEADISMKLASAHLKALRAARLVESERRGKNVICRLASANVARFWVTIRTLAEQRSFELQEALRQLSAETREWQGKTGSDLLRQAKKGEVIVIDVRPESEYQSDHLPCARSVPLSELKKRLSELPKNKPIVAYCRGPFCLMATEAVKLLRARGYDAHQLKDGVAEWAAREETRKPRAVSTA